MNQDLKPTLSQEARRDVALSKNDYSSYYYSLYAHLPCADEKEISQGQHCVNTLSLVSNA